MLPKDTRIGLLAPIAWPIPPQAYGAWERVVANLAKGLVAEGYTNVTLYATKQANVPGTKTVACIDVPLAPNPVPNGRELEHRHAEFAMKEAKNVDILHNHFNYHPLLFRGDLKTPVVTTLHGSAIEPESKKEYARFKNLPFVSISDAERAFLPELNYVATVYNGIDLAQFPIQPEKGSYLVQTGRINPTKGVHHAITLAKAVGVPLYLAGPVEAHCQNYFDAKIAPHVDGKSVFYLGNLSPERVADLVSHALAFVGLIEWDEPFGLSTVEAMVCGTPVIGTARGAHRETIVDRTTGLLVSSLEEAIARFEEIHQIDRLSCAENARSRFSLEEMTRGYLKAYERVLNG